MGDFGSREAGPMKRILLMMVVVGLTGLLGWWLSGNQEGASKFGSGVQAPANTDTTKELLESTDLVGEPADIEGRAVAEVAVNDPAETQSVAIPSIQRGRVVLVDEAGVEHRESSGQLTLMKWTGSRGEPDPIRVEVGSFEFDATNIDWVSVEDLIIDGRYATDMEDDSRHVLDAEEIVLRVKWTPSFTLNVLDADSGIHLDQVRVLWGQLWMSIRHNQHPCHWESDPETVWVASAHSPMTLPTTSEQVGRNTSVVFISSPGYAWKRIDVDLRQGGARTVRLVPGGQLEIHVAGTMPSGAQLRFRAPTEPDSVPLFSIDLDRSGEQSVHGVTSGELLVRVEVGDWFHQPTVLGSAMIDVVAGQVTDVDIALEPMPEPELGIVTGTLSVSEIWAFESIQMSATPMGHSGLRRGRPVRIDRAKMTELHGSWSFQFPPMPVGMYCIRFESARSRSEVEVPSIVELTSAGAHVDFTVGPPCTVQVTVLDGDTGEVADLQRISWGIVDPKTGYPSSRSSVPRAEGETYFEFRAPRGEISVGSLANGYTSMDATVEIEEGLNSFEFTLLQECPLNVAYMDDGVSIPAPLHLEHTFEHVGGEGKVLYYSSHKAEFQTAFDLPGEYRMDVSDIDGYEPIPTQTVTVKRGEPTRHVVQLVRKN